MSEYRTVMSYSEACAAVQFGNCEFAYACLLNLTKGYERLFETVDAPAIIGCHIGGDCPCLMGEPDWDDCPRNVGESKLSNN